MSAVVLFAVQYEWSTVAEPLAEQGYLTVIVNLNGNQKRMRPTEMLDLIGRHIVREHFKRESYILMGKCLITISQLPAVADAFYNMRVGR